MATGGAHRFWLALLLLCAIAISPEVAEARRGRKASRPTARPRVERRVEPLTAAGLPNIQAAAAAVIDARTGGEVFGKNADEVRAIASTGKIFVAMLVRRRHLPLDAVTEITRTDQQYARGGSRTRLPIGGRFTNVDLLRAMLVASDNRSVTALGRAVGLEPDDMVKELNALARDLGLKKTRFTDPVGIHGNESTAREMSIALREAIRDPLIAEIMTTPYVTIRSVARRPLVINYGNTNVPLHTGRYPIHGGKTGFSDPAGYCLVIACEIGGRELVMTFLGADGKLTRFADFNRAASWYESGASGAKLPRPSFARPASHTETPSIATKASGLGSL